MSKPLVYFIDDDEALTKVIERRFIAFGCDVRSFDHPDKLISEYRTKIPALILVDLNLGESLTGFDLIRFLRKDLKADIPILILSGESDRKQVAHGLEMGANDFIIKPPLRLEFEETIAQYISAENLPEPIQANFAPVNSTHAHAKVTFPLSIVELHPTGLTLLSDHLIKKGASFYLQGPEIRTIAPSFDRLFVIVISSATRRTPGSDLYEIFVEVSGSQEQALKEMNDFIYKKTIASTTT